MTYVIAGSCIKDSFAAVNSAAVAGWNVVRAWIALAEVSRLQ
jgi:hypothetical protein